MLYDLEKPIAFVKDIYNCLSDDGVWHTEQSYLPLMLDRNSYDTICHEHIEYYSLRSLKYLLDEVGFKIIEINFNTINGGSFVLTMAKKKSLLYKENIKKIHSILNQEKKKKIYSIATYKRFYSKIVKESKKLKEYLLELKRKNKLVMGYGASTKGNIILNFSKINKDLISNIAEVNQLKFGKITPGTNIDIISEVKARNIGPDYFLVLPWHFKNFIIKKEKKLNKNIKLIFPLPNLKVV